MEQAMDLGAFFDTKRKVEQKPWMEKCVMVLATAGNLKTLIDKCIASGLYALDLETTGLNNRVYNGRTKDRIVGVCLSPDGVEGYYIPLQHKKDDGTPYAANIPMSVFEPEFMRLLDSDARAIFHNGKFDQEFLEFATGTGSWGNWDDTNRWEDTLILAYLRNTRERRKGLKYLSEKDLDKEMIELHELFPPDHPKSNLDFSLLDPTELPVLWYGASDGICTWLLYDLLSKQVLEHKLHNQKFIYGLEKKNSVATRWMERNGIPIDLVKVKELITLGQRELVEALIYTYSELNNFLGRKVTPPYIKHAITKRVLDDPTKPIKEQLDAAKVYCHQAGLDRVGVHTDTAGKEWPGVYDILSAKQLGQALLECSVPDLPLTEKSKQVDTSRAALEAVTEKWGSQYPFLLRIRRVRELLKALSTYLQPLWNDTDRTLGNIKVNFVGTKVDTGRFSTPSGKPEFGGTTFFLQGIPAPYVKDRPECMLRLRECITVENDEEFLVAIDFSGVELRLGTNLSGEPLWEKEYFRCSDCDQQFPKGDGSSTPENPPPFCPKCGSDKIGDIHTLTALQVYGPNAKDQPGWKEKRQRGKGANFALLYGGSANAVERSTKCDKNEAFRIKRQFDSSYTVMTNWWARQHQFGRQHGYVVTAFGRKYPVPDINLPPVDPKTGNRNGGFVAKAERNAVNGVIQGASADITKMAMWLVYQLVRKRGWEKKLRMIITMHDELVFLIHREILEEAVDLICNLMTRNKAILNRKWPIPLAVDVDIGKTYAAAWKLFECQHKGEFPDELKPWFEGGTKAKEAPVAVLEDDRKPIPTTGAYVHKLRKPLTQGLLNDLAICIVYSKGKQPLFVQEINGVELGWPDGTVLVDAERFVSMARDHGI